MGEVEPKRERDYSTTVSTSLTKPVVVQGEVSSASIEKVAQSRRAVASKGQQLPDLTAQLAPPLQKATQTVVQVELATAKLTPNDEVSRSVSDPTSEEKLAQTLRECYSRGSHRTSFTQSFYEYKK